MWCGAVDVPTPPMRIHVNSCIGHERGSGSGRAGTKRKRSNKVWHTQKKKKQKAGSSAMAEGFTAATLAARERSQHALDEHAARVKARQVPTSRRKIFHSPLSFSVSPLPFILPMLHLHIPLLVDVLIRFDCESKELSFCLKNLSLLFNPRTPTSHISLIAH